MEIGQKQQKTKECSLFGFIVQENGQFEDTPHKKLVNFC